MKKNLKHCEHTLMRLFFENLHRIAYHVFFSRHKPAI